MRSVMRWTCGLLTMAASGAMAQTATNSSAANSPVPSTQSYGPGMPSTKEVSAHINQPKLVAAHDAALAQLRVPAGFRVTKFYEGLKNPRVITVAGDGTVYVTRREEGDCVMLKDTNGDGVADTMTTVARRPQLHGMCLSPDQSKAWFVTIKELFVADRRPDGSFGPLKRLIDDLPDAGQHNNRTIVYGPDGMLYLSVGSTTNSANEQNPQSATILRIAPDATSRAIFARGLRNTIGYAFHPQTQDLWGLDNGIDWLGDDDSPEELNLIQKGKNYGWPVVYGKGEINLQPEPPNNLTREEYLKLVTSPVLTYTPHAAPMEMLFYQANQFPAEYRGDAFATMRGSWNRQPPSGYEVVRIHFENNQPVSIKPFVKGFLIANPDGTFSQFARPFGLAVLKDGSLLVGGDDNNGVIYRVAYSGQ